MRENGVKMGLKKSSPDFHCSWVVFVFSKITVLLLKSLI